MASPTCIQFLDAVLNQRLLLRRRRQTELWRKQLVHGERHCQYLFIDEAHHIGAPRWREFRDAFSKSRIVQFTATPFRNDDRPVDGRRIFTFPLRKAQEQGYFKRIRFKPVSEFNPAKRDVAIAEAAVAQLRADLHLGHIFMARVATVARAEEVFEHYRHYQEFLPSKSTPESDRRKNATTFAIRSSLGSLGS